jgi:hypothetical protein
MRAATASETRVSSTTTAPSTKETAVPITESSRTRDVELDDF